MLVMFKYLSLKFLLLLGITPLCVVLISGCKNNDLELNQTMENKMFYLGLYNITDEKYEQPDGYNQLGINFQAGIRITM